MKKELAVEWLVNQISEKMGIRIDVSSIGESLLKQAKEMEKEQIIYAHLKGHNAPSSTIKNWDAEQYYNETFKQQEQ